MRPTVKVVPAAGGCGPLPIRGAPRGAGGDDAWIVAIRRAPDERTRLFCLPFAGGGASPFRGWADHPGAGISLFAVVPPGRESRFAEPPLTDFHLLVRRVVAALLPLADRPFVLFGHSLGAAVAYEAARALERRGAVPELLFVSGRQAPHLPALRAPIAHLPDAAFIQGVAELNGTPAEVLATPELVDLLLPLLRADFTLAEQYRPLPGGRLTCPVIALGGRDDRWLDAAGLEAWRGVTSGPFATHLFPGDHFYLLRHGAWLLSWLAERIEARSARAAA